jgi:hypothetical protein
MSRVGLALFDLDGGVPEVRGWRREVCLPFAMLTKGDSEL